MEHKTNRVGRDLALRKGHLMMVIILMAGFLLSASSALATDGVWSKLSNAVPTASDTTSTSGRIPLGTAGKGDDVVTHYANVIYVNGTYKMWYTGDAASGNMAIFYATSPDGLNWTKYDNTTPAVSNTTGTNGRIPHGGASRADTSDTYCPSVLLDDGTYKMWYTGNYGAHARILYATSSDGFTWTKLDNTIPADSSTSSTNGRIPQGLAGSGDDIGASCPTVIKDGSTYKMWYTGSDGLHTRIYYATSPDGLTWTKYNNAILAANDTTGTNGRIPLSASQSKGDFYNVKSPMVVKDGSTYRMWYSGQECPDDGVGGCLSLNSRIFQATSSDGLTWTKTDVSIPSASNTTSTNSRIPIGTSGGDTAGISHVSVVKNAGTFMGWYSGKVSYDKIYYASMVSYVPTVTSIVPNTGFTSGGNSITITGTNFFSGATVTVGGSACTSVNVASSTSLTCNTPAHAAGAVNVVVTNSDAQSGTLTNGFTYLDALNAQFNFQSGVPTWTKGGATFTASLSFRNTGSTTWSEASSFRLGSQNPADNGNWGTGRVYLTGGETIPYNSNKIWSINATSPATSGAYNFQWQMVQDGVAWFGATSTNVVVNVDADSPTTSANNSSADWQTSNPTITLSTADTGGSGLSYSKYSWDSSDATCRTSGTSFSNGNTITIPSQGTHTLYLCNADVVTNTGSWNGTYKLDSAAPTASINSVSGDSSSPYVDITNNNDSDIILTINDLTSGVANCRFASSSQAYGSMTSNCAAPSNGTASCDLGNLSQGSYTYYYACIDVAGNLLTQQPAAFSVDWTDQITGVQASDGTYTDKVTITWNSDSSATGYKVWNGSSWIDVGNVTAYDDTLAPSPSITPGTVSASDGTDSNAVNLSLSGASANAGSVVAYKVRGYNSNGDGPESVEENGNKGIGSLTIQWQRSEADIDANYSDLIGATDATYADTNVPVSGEGRYYRVVLNATGITQVIASSDRGYRATSDISVSPGGIHLGSLAVGRTSSPQSFTISNNGTGALNVATIALVDDTHFNLDVNGGSDPCGDTTFSVPVGDSCTVTATFAPQSTGIKATFLDITSNDPDTFISHVSLMGDGYDGLVVSGVNHNLTYYGPVTPTISGGAGSLLATLNGENFMSGTTVSDEGSYILHVQDDVDEYTIHFTIVYGVTITNPNPTKIIDEALLTGYIQYNGSDATQTSQADFNVALRLQNGNATLVIPQNVRLERNGGGDFDLTSLTTQDITNEVRSDDLQTKAAVRIGIPNQQMSFSNGQVTITLVVGTEYNGQSVEVSYRNAGQSDWSHETYCTIANGNCIFQTDHATDFKAGAGQLNVNETAQINLDLEATISLACTDTVTMGSITGYGKSDLASNTATCNVRTNNSGGYKLEWQASSDNMSTGAPNNDTFAAYTPNTPDTPEAWDVATTESGWGARMSDTSTTDNTVLWGADDQSGTSYGTTAKWLNVRSASPFQIVSRTTETDNTGDDEVILFGAEIGSGKIQPTGTYSVNVVMTATTL